MKMLLRRLLNWKFHLLFIFIVIFASIPSIWVFQNRWLDTSPGYRLVHKYAAWCSWQLFCQSTLPTLAIVGFLACAIALAFLFLWMRKTPVSFDMVKKADFKDLCADETIPNRSLLVSRILLWTSCIGFFLTVANSLLSGSIPGWNLIIVYVCFITGCLLQNGYDIADWIRRNAGFLLSIIINHILLITALYFYTQESQLVFIIIGAFIISLANLLRYRHRLSPVYFIFLLALILFTIQINTWWTSFVGDEYSLFDLGRSLASGRGLLWFGNNIFSIKGNYGATPLLATYIQVFFMKILGANGFGWRFSNVYLCAAGIVLIFYFLRHYFLERVALIAAVLLASSEYLMSFVTIGYTNLQAFFAAALVLALTAWSLRSKTMLAFGLLGSSLAFCFYSFPAALAILPLPIFLLFLYYPPTAKEAIKRWGIMFAALGMLIFPIFLQPEYWIDLAQKPMLANPEVMRSGASILDHFLSNGYYSFFSFLYAQQETHFVAVSYVDPVTGVFILIGFFHLLWNVRHNRFIAFWLTGYFFLLLVVGVFHINDFPSTTRMFMLLPWWMVFAAVGLEFLFAHLSALFHFSWKISTGVVLGLILLIIGINIYQSNKLSYLLFTSRPAPNCLYCLIQLPLRN
ncbi:MAG: glycosyltransferase family 39 protein [Anaerolineales bacterium]